MFFTLRTVIPIHVLESKPFLRFIPLISVLFLTLLEPGCDGRPENGAPETPTRSAVDARRPWFHEVAEERGISFSLDSGFRERHLLPEIMAGGVGLFDMENDGDLDAYLVQAGVLADASRRSGNRLFSNDGTGMFTDVTDGSGSGHTGYGMGVSAGDVDGDGLTDLYVTNYGPNLLLTNEDGVRFRDVSSAFGVNDRNWGTSSAFHDFDRDGDLDLFVANYLDWSVETDQECVSSLGEPDYCGPVNYKTAVPDLLYLNDGEGRFRDVSEPSGLHTAYGAGLGVVCADFDEDGHPDIFVANDGSKNQLWMNQGDGTFADQAVLRGCAVDDSGGPKACMGVNVADLDDNGTLDLHVVNLETETDSYYRNAGSYFSDMTASVGLALQNTLFTRFGAGMVDFDNDGRLDLYSANGRIYKNNPKRYGVDPFAEPNILFRGQPGPRFEEVLPRGGTAELLAATSRGAAFGDVDNDGGMDLLVVNRDAPAHLLHNRAPNRGNWIMFEVVNRAGSPAEGARVTAGVGSIRKMRDVRSAYSYLAANDPRVHFGLGRETEILGVVVRWPDGSEEEFGDFAANQIVRIAPGTGRCPETR